MPGIHERDGIRWWNGVCRRFNIAPEHYETLYDVLVAHFQPPVERASADAIADLKATFARVIAGLEPGAVLDERAVMRENGFDPKVRSDLIQVTKYLKENELLTHQGATPQKFIRRLVNGGGPRADAPNATAD